MPARYKILRKIADGGMAELFLATQRGAEGFERPVVLKRILAALLADPSFRNNMIDEAHVAMSLNHSNIVQVLDLGQSKGRYFLVLELVDGWDVNHLLGRVKNADFALRPELGLYIVAEVCRALAYAHARHRNGQPLGIVHRDVTPHNVLVSDHGEVKLTDFGIAKALNRRERTGQGVIKGKLAFMSPEQASGGALDARSDLFSVGTMLYLMFTGRRPFDAPTDLETVLRVQQCEFPPPTSVKPDLAPEIDRIIQRAMKRNPAERYQTAEEMLVDVEAAQRTVFRPAGQTELRRWLLELGDKDRLPTISRAQAPPRQPDEEVDLAEDIVFEEMVGDTLPPGALMRPSSSTGLRRAAKALESALAAAPAKDTRFDQPALPLEPAKRPPRSSRRGWLLAGLLVGAAGAAGIALLLRPGDVRTPASLEQVPDPSPIARAPIAPPLPPPQAAATPPPVAPTTAAVPAAPEDARLPAPASAAAGAERDAAAAQPSAGKPADATALAARPDAEEGGAIAAAPAAGTEPDAEEDDEDEETLYQRRDPDIATKVIGEEAGTPAPPPPPPKVRVSSGASKAPPPPPPREAVSVRVESRPVGAVVQIGRHVLGRAPLSLRFNSGITYDLTFVKGGYETAKKRYTVTRKKGQLVGVTLKKRPATTGKRGKNFFQRLFGG